MAILRRLYQTDREIEKRVLIGLIVSDKVLAMLFPYISPDVFELEVSRTIIRWILDYYQKYRKSPQRHIQDIFSAEKSNIKTIVALEIEAFLGKLSSDYMEEGGPQGINEAYMIDKGKAYFKERIVRKTATDTLALLDSGKIDAAEEIWQKGIKLAKRTTYKWVAPFDDMDFLASVFDEKEEALFDLRGQVGTLVGGLRRGWLLGVMGPMKRGKSWILEEIAINAMLAKKRVVVVNLEMKDADVSSRYYQQIGVLGGEKKVYVFPCFDCLNNQDGQCNKFIRTNKESCPSAYSMDSKYKPCTACRNLEGEKKNFLPGVWYFSSEQPGVSILSSRREVKRFQRTFGKNLFRLLTLPSKTHTMEDIEEQLDDLEKEEGFIPDVLITDYATLLKSSEKGNRIEKMDDIWVQHKRVSQSRSLFVASGSQSLGLNRAALKKSVQDETDIAETATILAHVDILMTVDQTPKEKEAGYWRLGVIEHRHKKFNKRHQAMCLNQLDLGQPVLDTELIYYDSKGGTDDE